MQLPAKIRHIDEYCLPLILDTTPYPSADFDHSVHEYCRKISPYNYPVKNINNTKTSFIQDQNDQTINGDKTEPQKDLKELLSQNFDQQNQNDTRECWKIIGDDCGRTCKVIVIGDVAVGKTCLINRFGYEIYSNQYKTTIGVDFDIQKFTILGVPFTLQLWDTAGLERFKSITSSYYRGCHVAIIVFDMSNLSTLTNALHWHNELLKSCRKTIQPIQAQPKFNQLSQYIFSINNGQNNSTTKNENIELQSMRSRNELTEQMPLMYLVGSKKDLLNDVEKDFAFYQARRVANHIKAELWFVSAQTSDNVNELFTRISCVSFNQCILSELNRIKFETSTLGLIHKQNLLQYQKELWNQNHKKLIKITRRKKGDADRSKCINIKCVIK